MKKRVKRPKKKKTEEESEPEVEVRVSAYYNDDELVEYMDELHLTCDSISEGKLHKMAVEFQRGGKRDRGVKHRDNIRRGLEACRVLLECLEAGVKLPQPDDHVEFEGTESANKNQLKRKARKMRKRQEERELRDEKLRHKIRKHEKLKQKYETQERKARKWLDLHEKNREARLRREERIIGAQKAREADILRERKMKHCLHRLQKMKEKAQGRIADFQKMLDNLMNNSDVDSDETDSSFDGSEVGSDEDFDLHYRAFIYDDEEYDSCGDDEEKPSAAFKKFPGGLRERLPLWKYKKLEDEYNTMASFLSYEMNERDFRNNGAGKIYDRLAYNGETSFSAMCTKFQAYIYIDWLFEENESAKVAISSVMLERIWREPNGMVCKIRFPPYHMPDDRIQANVAITLSRGSISLSGMIEDVDAFSHFMFVSFNVRTTKEKGHFFKERDLFDVYVESSMFSQTSALRAIDLALTHGYGPRLFPQEEPAPNRYASEFNSLEFEEDSTFNYTQKLAIYEIVRGYSQCPFVLFGPPGTGKTTVLVEAISQILAENPNARILICAPSGRAADVVAERILAKKVIHPDFIFRLNSLYAKVKERNRKIDEIAEFVNPKAAEAVTETKEGEFSHFFSGYKIHRLSVLKRFRIIISTLSASSYLVSGKMPRSHFTHIFIDEAGQSIEPETWIPITGLAGSSTRIILCGDPKQLGPISNFKIAQQLECNKSMLERLCGLPYYRNNKSMMVILKDAYRCHPAILSLPSTMFYNGHLQANKENDRSALYHRLAKCSILPKPGFPLIFYSVTSGEEEKIPTSSSYFNRAEVERVSRYVRMILHEEIAGECDIGVISPYKLQTQKLREELKAYKGIVIDSVERFQGSERRVIIMTTVRTRDIGFLASEQRFNTAVTRAQNLLIVVGNANALWASRTWQKFIDYCSVRGGFLMD